MTRTSSKLTMNRSIVFALLASLALFAIVGLTTAKLSDPTVTRGCWFVLLAASTSLCCAVVALRKEFRQHDATTIDRVIRLAPAAIVIAASTLVIVRWQQSLTPQQQPLIFWLTDCVLRTLPVLFLALLLEERAARLWQRGYVNCLVVVLGMVAAVSIWQYLAIARPGVGGVDFFFFLCGARDMMQSPDEVAMTSYRYFPGVYQFWRAAYCAVDGELAGLQWCYIFLVLANALCISVLVIRLARHWQWGVLASVWYCVVVSRFEGLDGITEPLVTLPLLIGLIVWRGEPLRDKYAWWRTLVLGVAFGIAVACKQQAALLAMGYVALLLHQWKANEERRHAWRYLIAVPCIALLVLLACVLIEGRGFEPLRVGLGMLSSYPSHGGWLENLWSVARNDESLALFALLFAIVFGVVMVRRARNVDVVGTSWFSVVAFCFFAAVLTLIQFRTRGYYHYALLGAPLTIVGVVTIIDRVVIPWLQSREVGWLGMMIVGWAIVFPLYYTGGDTQSLWVWRLRPSDQEVTPTLWHQQPDVAMSLKRMTNEVDAGERLFVFPARRNAIHFVLDTRSAHTTGYSFHPDALDTIDWSEGTGVIVVRESADATEPQELTPEEREQLSRTLQDNGLVVERQTNRLTLYRRLGAKEE